MCLLENRSEDSEEEGEGWISWGAGQQQQKLAEY